VEIGPREFLRAFLYSYVVTSAQLLGSKAPALRRAVCRNAARALLREHPELEDLEPVEMVKAVAESLLGASVSVDEDASGGVAVRIEGCRICPRDLIEEFVRDHPELKDPIFGYNVCAFTTLIEEVFRALGEEVELKHEPVERGRCRVIVKASGNRADV